MGGNSLSHPKAHNLMISYKKPVHSYVHYNEPYACNLWTISLELNGS